MQIIIDQRPNLERNAVHAIQIDTVKGASQTAIFLTLLKREGRNV